MDGAQAAEVELLQPSVVSAIAQEIVALVVAAGAPEHPVRRVGAAAEVAVAGAAEVDFAAAALAAVDFGVKAQQEFDRRRRSSEAEYVRLA